MKPLFSILLLCLSSLTLSAKDKWYDPLKADSFVIQNQGWTNEIGRCYTRLPERTKDVLRKPVCSLAGDAAGLSIHFYTNARKITVRYGVSRPAAMDHMPATGKSGIDLYAIDPDGNWNIITDKYLFKDTITYTYNNLKKSKFHNHGFEFRMFLPMYNHVNWMEIGIPDSAELKFIPVRKEKPIVVYGTSVAQGGCASRPAMAWTNIISRTLDIPVINLGFSGQGYLEKEFVNYINELDAALYIYDCLPNMGALDSAEIYNRTVYGVTELRKKHNAPILITDHIGYRNDKMIMNTAAASERVNRISLQAYEALVKSGMKNIWYLHKDSIHFPDDGCVDFIHPNDLGMKAYADAYIKIIREILNMPLGSLTTTIPVSQRREPDIYEWKNRHREILEHHEMSPSKKVIIGNSIIHYWEGEPSCNHANGPESWNNFMKPAGFYNLGFGWDRIENVLWRVYHGELDGFRANEIVLMIGTNNLFMNNDHEILAGLEFLIKQIKIRQPSAKIKILGLLPRRNDEKRILSLNIGIAEIAKSSGCTYIDAGSVLLLKNGIIDESLFLDGLHPNEKGYRKIAPLITAP